MYYRIAIKYLDIYRSHSLKQEFKFLYRNVSFNLYMLIDIIEMFIG